MTGSAAQKGIFSLLLVFPASFVSHSTDLFHYEVEVRKQGLVPGAENSAVASKINLFYENNAVYIWKDSMISSFDLGKKKIYFLNSYRQEYDETSLYSVPDYNHNKFLQEFLRLKQESKDKDEDFYHSLFFLESFYGVEANHDSLSFLISEKMDGDTLTYLLEDTPIFKIVFNEELPEQNANLLEKFMLYENHIHPYLVSEVQKNNMPEYLSYSFEKGDFEYTFTYTLKKFTPGFSPEEKLKFASFQYDTEKSSKLLSLINQVYGYVQQKPVKFPEPEIITEQVNNHINKKNYLDAFLLLQETLLSSGYRYPELEEKVLQGKEKDRHFRNFLSAIKPIKNKDELHDNLKTLKKLSNRKKLQKGYVINTYIAELNLKTGNIQKALDNILSMFRKNPYITAAYFQLGDIFSSMGDGKSAWKCYDICQIIAPQHLVSQQIIDKKLFLEKEFPEYFLR